LIDLTGFKEIHFCLKEVII